MWNFGGVFGSFPCRSTEIAKTSMILRKGLDAWLLHLSFKGMKSMGWMGTCRLVCAVKKMSKMFYCEIET